MFWRLLAKLMFKACVPLILLAGVLTYGFYLRGGDPGALWKGIAGKASAQVASLFSGARDDVSQAASALSRSAADTVGSDDGRSGLTQVFTWKDASGMTHYSTTRPTGVSATSVRVDPNVNVLAPVRAPVPMVRPANGAESSVGDVDHETGASMPGVAGQVLSTRSERQAGSEASGATIDPAQLLRMLQAAEK